MNEQSRKAFWAFLGVVGVLATAVYIPVVYTGSFEELGGLALPLLMWAPGVSGIVVSIAVYRSLRPVGLGIGWNGVVWALVCLLLPLTYTLATYLPLAGLNLVGLSSENLSAPFFVIGFAQSLLFAAGEEIGWRGFAAPVFARRFGFVRGQIVLGLVWFVYHLPALLFTTYGKSSHAIAGNAMFLCSVVALSVFLGWVRLSGKSLWPTALFHAAHNLLFLHLFDPMHKLSPLADWLIGEQGLMLVLVTVLLAIVAVRASRGRERDVAPAMPAPDQSAA